MKPFFLLSMACLLFIGCASNDTGYYNSEQSVPPYTAPDGSVPPPMDPNAQIPLTTNAPAQPATTSQAYTQRPATNEPRPWDTAAKPAANTAAVRYPVATLVKGKKGLVTSPYAQYAGPVSVEGIAPGTQVKCPYTGKIFIVP